jgi:hypothetical protein
MHFVIILYYKHILKFFNLENFAEWDIIVYNLKLD